MTKRSYILGAIILVLVIVAGVFFFAGQKASAPSESPSVSSSTAPVAPIAPVAVPVSKSVSKPAPKPFPKTTVSNDFPPKLFFDTAYVDGKTTYFSVSVVGGEQNKNVLIWKLKVTCPSGVSVSDKSGVSYCDTSHDVLPSGSYDPMGNYLFLSAAAVNGTSAETYAAFTLSAFDKEGNQIGNSTGTLALRAPAASPSAAQ